MEIQNKFVWMKAEVAVLKKCHHKVSSISKQEQQGKSVAGKGKKASRFLFHREWMNTPNLHGVIASISWKGVCHDAIECFISAWYLAAVRGWDSQETKPIALFTPVLSYPISAASSGYTNASFSTPLALHLYKIGGDFFFSHTWPDAELDKYIPIIIRNSAHHIF